MMLDTKFCQDCSDSFREEAEYFQKLAHDDRRKHRKMSPDSGHLKLKGQFKNCENPNPWWGWW